MAAKAELTERQQDELDLCRLNDRDPVYQRDTDGDLRAIALVGSILRQRAHDLVTLARGKRINPMTTSEDVATDLALWLREVGLDFGHTTADIRQFAIEEAAQVAATMR